MFRPIRALLSLALLVGLIWASFHVPLGSFTFADHVDRIGQTPEAQDLVDGARSTVNPVIEEAKDRMLGEYIEAPTQDTIVPADAIGPVTAEGSKGPNGPEDRPRGRLPR